MKANFLKKEHIMGKTFLAFKNPVSCTSQSSGLPSARATVFAHHILMQVPGENWKRKASHVHIFVSFCCFSFFDQLQQCLKFHICEIDDIALWFLRTWKPCMS